MIILNEFRVTPDGKWLKIDVQTRSIVIEEVETQILMESVSVVTGNTAVDTEIASLINAAFNSSDKKHFVYSLEIESLNVPFELTVIADDTPLGEHYSCKYEKTLQAITFNKYPIYKVLACLTNLFDGCTPPSNFIDFLMKLKALEAFVAIGDFTKVTQYYKKLITGVNENFNPASPTCGCNR